MMFSGRVAFAAAALCALVFCGTATAGTALTGSSFPISYLDLPPNALPGSVSGSRESSFVSSPVTPDGRYVFFTSQSDNLAVGSDPEIDNIFRKDTQTGDVVLVNRDDGANGPAFGGHTGDFVPSADGNLVLMVTDAAIDPSDSDGNDDIYLRNIQAETTTLMTPSITEDVESADLSADGRYIAFTTSQALYPGDGNGTSDVYRMKVADNAITIASAVSGSSNAGNDGSDEPSISDDGSWIAFSSKATNLVAGFNDDNGIYSRDVFVRDVDGNTTSLVSAKYNSAISGGDAGSEEPEIAGGPVTLGQVKVAYSSSSTTLADNAVTDPSDSASVYLRSMSVVPSVLVSRATGAGGVNADSRAHTPSISDDGSRIVFSSDAGNLGAGASYYGTYLRDLTDSTTTLLSAHNYYSVFGQISGNGQFGTWSEAGGATTDSDPDLTSVFIRSLPSGQARLVSRPSGSNPIQAPSFESYVYGGRIISATGRYFAFTTSSSHLPGWQADTQGSQAYRRDLRTGAVELVSRADGVNGAPAQRTGDVSMSSDGNLIAFQASDSLVPADINDVSDIYVRNLTAGTTTLVSRADGPDGAVGSNGSEQPVISGDGNRVAFVSRSSNLGGSSTDDHVYVRDLSTNHTMVASRATGAAGALADDDSGHPSLSYDGSRVVFTSYGKNLDPDDGLVSQSIYLRNLDSDQTFLVSRAPGLNGASLDDYVLDPIISGNGSLVAFIARDAAAVPDTAPWPAGSSQIVVRNLSDGANQLASISSNGQPGDGSSGDPSLSRDGKIIAFDTEATNLRDGFDNTGRDTVIVRDLGTGAVTGPPRFGLASASTSAGSSYPSVSDSGDCVAFDAYGHNDLSGYLGDSTTSWIFVNRGTCLNPRNLVPQLSAVKLKPRKFRVSPKATAKIASKKKPKKKKKSPRGTKISFTLNTTATVTVTIEQKIKGRKVGKKCVKATRKNRRKKACTRLVKRGQLVREDLAAGRQTIPFSGRIGRKALKLGGYRVVLQASTATDSSNRPTRPFRIVKR